MDPETSRFTHRALAQWRGAPSRGLARMGSGR